MLLESPLCPLVAIAMKMASCGMPLVVSVRVTPVHDFITRLVVTLPWGQAIFKTSVLDEISGL